MQAPTEIFEAIALQKCLLVTYNKMVVTLAPHILYTRHDEMFIDAVTVDRDGRPPRELKLGTFKLVGLSDIKVLDEPFEAMHGLYDQNDDKYRGVTLFNPIVYLISGFRWTFFGKGDVGIEFSLIFVAGMLTICLGIIGWMFRTGYRLKK